MKKEKALEIYKKFSQQLKADPTLGLPGDYLNAMTTLKSFGIDLAEIDAELAPKKEEVPSLAERFESAQEKIESGEITTPEQFLEEISEDNKEEN